MSDQNDGFFRRLWRRLLGDGDGRDLPPEQPLRVPEEFRNIGRQPPAQTPSAAPDHGIDLVFLRQQMLNFLSEEQLAAMAAELGLDFDVFPGGKGRKTQAFLGECQRRGLLPRLLAACRALEPAVSWQPKE